MQDLHALNRKSHELLGISQIKDGLRRCDSIRLQIRPQWCGNQHAAIRLLVRLDEGHEQPRQRRAAAVEDVRESIFAAGFGFETKLHPSRLKILAV